MWLIPNRRMAKMYTTLMKLATFYLFLSASTESEINRRRSRIGMSIDFRFFFYPTFNEVFSDTNITAKVCVAYIRAFNGKPYKKDRYQYSLALKRV